MALGIHPERALLYLIRPTHPVGLPAIPATSGQFTAPEAERLRWSQQSLLEDLVELSVMPAADADRWHGEPLESLYRDGLCGGAFASGTSSATRHREVLVPMAQQSALAGIILATQVVTASDPRLRELRPDAIEGRIDLMAPLPQIVTRPRLRTPGCLCFDADYGGSA